MHLPLEVQLTSSLAGMLPPIPQSASPLARSQSLQLISTLGVQLPTLNSCMQGLCIIVGTRIQVGLPLAAQLSAKPELIPSQPYPI